MKHDQVVRDLARSQQLLVTRHQLLAAGLDRRAISRRIQSGMLEGVTSRVFRLGGSPTFPAQRLMIPLLHVGREAYISHTTAAAWWGIAGFRIDRIHLSIERVFHWQEKMRPVIVHHSTVIPDWCRKIHRGVPIVSPALVVLQLAGSLDKDRVSRALDSAWSLRLLDGQTVDALLVRLGRKGRNGVTVLRELRRLRPDPWVPPASNLESRFGELAERNGMRFRRQVNVGDEEWSGRVDFLADDCPLIVEILSERYHASLTDRANDEARRDRHAQMGFVVVEVWDHEIFHAPGVVIDRIRRARAALLARVSVRATEAYPYQTRLGDKNAS